MENTRPQPHTTETGKTTDTNRFRSAGQPRGSKPRDDNEADREDQPVELRATVISGP